MNNIFAQNQAAYDKIVLDFARRNHTPLEGSLLALALKMAGHVGPGGRVLDIGCGTGRDMQYFENCGLQVTGIDLSMGMLDYARHEVHGNLVQMNMCALGFPSGCFEGLWSSASMLHIPKKEAPGVLQEFRRVVKPGGMLGMTVQKGEGERWVEAYVPGVMRFFVYYQVDELAELLGANGFSVQGADDWEARERSWLAFACTAA